MINEVLTTTLLHALASCLVTLAIWRTMSPDHIFERLGEWLHKHLPEPIHKPVFDCPVCMYPYYGTAFWLLVLNADPITWQRVVVFVVAGMGMQVVLLSLINIPGWLESMYDYKKEHDEWG